MRNDREAALVAALLSALDALGAHATDTHAPHTAWPHHAGRSLVCAPVRTAIVGGQSVTGTSTR